MINQIGEEELIRILRNQSYIRFTNRKGLPNIKDLSKEEKTFLYTVWEHFQHQKLYGPYILPAVFVAYKAPEDLLEFRPYNLNKQLDRGLKKSAVEEDGATFNRKNFKIVVKKGETVYAMIQDFQNLSHWYLILIQQPLQESKNNNYQTLETN